MTKTKRRVLMSVLMLLLCVAMVAAGTYALFTDRVDLHNHLSAGTLERTLERTSLTKWNLDNTTGFFVKDENKTVIDFSDPGLRSIFDIGERDLIVPLSEYTAEMRITNNSDVAFHYWIEIVFDDAADLAIADQLYVTLTSVNGKIEGYLSELGTGIGSEENPISTISTEKEKNFETFTVSIKFDDLEDSVNNDAKSQSISFDLIVHAVQVTPEDTP